MPSHPTVGDLLVRDVPTGGPDETTGEVLARLCGCPLSQAGHVYLLEGDLLVGQVPVERLLSADRGARLGDLRGPDPLDARPGDDAERVALRAVRHHAIDVAVADHDGRFLGALRLDALLTLLHHSHHRRASRHAGLGRSHPEPAQRPRTWRAYRARMGWLLFGLAGGTAASALVGAFEEELRRTLALAFFLPLVVYLADAVGTQTEAVTVRSLALGRRRPGAALLQEGSLGLLMGATLAGASWGLLRLLGQSGGVAEVVGLTLFVTAVLAALVATAVPLALSWLGADPAYASGPLATVVQDLLSIAVYLGVAALLL